MQHIRLEPIPQDATGRLSSRATAAVLNPGEHRRGRDDKVAHRVVHLGHEPLPAEDLAVVDDGGGGGGGVDDAQAVQHGPLEVEEAVALAEADPLLVDGARARHHQADLEAPVDDVGERDRAGDLLHAVQGGGVLVQGPVDEGRVQQLEPPADAVGGGQDLDAGLEGLFSEVLEAVVRGDEDAGQVPEAGLG